MADFVKEVLQAEAEKHAQFKTTEVEKNLEVEIDEGNLLAVDSNFIDIKNFKDNPSQYIHNLCRDNTQLLFNALWKLPVEIVDDVVTVKLPVPKTVLPREKAIPAAKPLTKWERFARQKGIQKNKKSTMVWDEMHKDWRPRWGYKRANTDTQQFVTEHRPGDGPNVNPAKSYKAARKERVAKNEVQRLRNVARALKLKVPGVGLTPTESPDLSHVTKARAFARLSTASIGKFTDKLPKEKPQDRLGKKRKFLPNYGDAAQEKNRSIDILNSVMNKRPRMDVNTATNRQILEEDRRPNKKAVNKRRSKAGLNVAKAKKGHRSSKLGRRGSKKAKHK